MSYTGAILELRQMLSDTAFNKKATKKKLLGQVNAENTQFITYDKRILEDTVEVFVNDLAVGFTVDDAVMGKLTLSSAPDLNSSVEASYYWTWWIDDELINFLNKGAETVSQWTSTVPDDAYLQILPGLKTPALMVACSLATRALIQYMLNRRHSEEFLIEQDGNSDTNFSSTISAMQEVANQYWKDGIAARDDFYKRQGKRSAPAFGVKLGITRKYGPMR